MSSVPRLSVVSPVYNAAPYLEAFLASIAEQDLPEYELVAVNDGSTDDSGAILDAAAARDPRITVIHQANSGWAGAPRNAGIDAARGEYVFFADPDDTFGGPEAFRRMVDFADAHGSDVVLPRMVAAGGRAAAQWRYAHDQVDAHLATAFTTLTPQKLFRRSFLTAQRLRFPEGKVRLEDGIFLSRAYLLAPRVSILTGYRFYVLTAHDDGGHLSRKRIDPAGYVGSVAQMCRNVEALAPDAATRDEIIAGLFARKALLGAQPARFLKYQEKNRRAWMAAQREFVDEFITAARYALLSPDHQAVVDLLRADDYEGMVKQAQTSTLTWRPHTVEARRGTVFVTGTFSAAVPDGESPLLILEDRHHEMPSAAVPLRRVPASDDYRAAIGRTQLRGLRPERGDWYDVFAAAGERGARTRVAAPQKTFDARFTDDRDIRAYATKQGNLSFELHPGLSRRARLTRAAGRLLGRRKGR